MENLVLLAAIAAVFALGFLIMKKVDEFLDESQCVISESAHELRIAFENPVIAESVAYLLEQFSKKCPDCDLYLFSGSAYEINQKLEERSLDCGFVLSEFITSDDCEILSATFTPKMYISTVVGLPIHPLETKERSVKIVWRKAGCSTEMNLFTACLAHYINGSCLTMNDCAMEKQARM